MSAAHTPGPWVLNGTTVVPIAGQVEIAEILVDEELAEDGSLTGTSLADARLIVAAPELLQACEKAVEWMEGWASADPYIDVLRAAIALATEGATS